MARRPLTARQKLDAIIKLMEGDIRDAFASAVADVVNNTLLNQLVAAIEAGDLVRAFELLGFSQAALRPLMAAIERAYETGGVFTGDSFPKYINTTSGRAVFRFDVRNSRAEAWLRDHSSQLVTRLTDEARVVVRNTLQDGMQRGVNPRNVALDIVGRRGGDGKRVGGVIGLTEQQEGWVRSARAKLQDTEDWLERERASRSRGTVEPSDHPYFQMALRDKRFDRTVEKAIRNGEYLPADTVDKLITRYKDNALKHRGEVIARTEALQSLNASEYEAIKQAVDLGATDESAVRREWDSAGDKRVRWSHRRMDGQRVGLNEPFTSPSGAKMLHPGDTSLGAPGAEVIMCRCRAKTVIDWLAGVD